MLRSTGTQLSDLSLAMERPSAWTETSIDVGLCTVTLLTMSLSVKDKSLGKIIEEENYSQHLRVCSTLQCCQYCYMLCKMFGLMIVNKSISHTVK